ncbi:MAG: tetratricopeptide repeat protein [Isosphaeraceae bacterium]
MPVKGYAMADAYEENPRRQKAKVFFERANDAAMKDNFDYAVQMYQDSCKLAPEEVQYRQALRGVERRRFDNEPSNVGRLVGARNQPIRLRAKADLARKNYAQALQTCEEAFVHNPWDVQASLIAAEAAEQLNLPILAMFLIESVFPQGGDDLNFLRHAARVYEANGAWNKAIHCWEKVRKIAPSDEGARGKINQLAANATINKSGLNKTGSGSTRTISPEEEEEIKARAAAKAEELKRTALTPDQRWEKEIEEDPTSIRPYLDWADSLRGRNRLDEAEKLLARGLKANPGDAALMLAHADTQIARLRRAIDAWSLKARDNPRDIEAQAKLKQLQEMLRDYELKEYRRRVQLSPEDAELRLELGQRLANAGQHDQAIAEFQVARNEPRLKVQALMQLASSFEANGVIKLAERSLQEALKAADEAEAATVNALHYRLGKIAEAQGDLKKAEDHFNEVAANDYTYLDVAQRLRALAQRD